MDLLHGCDRRAQKPQAGKGGFLQEQILGPNVLDCPDIGGPRDNIDNPRCLTGFTGRPIGAPVRWTAGQ